MLSHAKKKNTNKMDEELHELPVYICWFVVEGFGVFAFLSYLNCTIPIYI